MALGLPQFWLRQRMQPNFHQILQLLKITRYRIVLVASPIHPGPAELHAAFRQFHQLGSGNAGGVWTVFYPKWVNPQSLSTAILSQGMSHLPEDHRCVKWLTWFQVMGNFHINLLPRHMSWVTWGGCLYTLDLILCHTLVFIHKHVYIYIVYNIYIYTHHQYTHRYTCAPTINQL